MKVTIANSQSYTKILTVWRSNPISIGRRSHCHPVHSPDIAATMNRLGTAGDATTRTVEEARIIEFLLLGGWVDDLRRGGRPAAVEATRAALNRWVEAGLPVAGDDSGVRHYDPVEVLNFMKWAGLHEDDPFWSARYLTTGRGFVLRQDAGWAEAGEPGDPALLPPRQFEVSFQRTFNLASIRPGTSIRLRLPLPLEGTSLDDLRIDLDDADPSIQFGVTPGRLEARLQAPDMPLQTLGYRASFTARPYSVGAGQAAALDAEEAELYTRPVEGFIRVTARVAALAEELAGGLAAPPDAAQAFWDYLTDRMICGAVHYHEIDAGRPMDWLLDHGWYDCEIGAALLVSLCRARGIPARIVSGYMLYKPAPTYHFWAEIWLGRWVPFDLLSWDLSSGGRDGAWRGIFAGKLDYRMTVQRLPRYFVGPMSVRLPRRWHVLTQALKDGIRMGIHDIDSGALAFSDDISVDDGDQAPG
jgi:hypothetical protein